MPTPHAKAGLQSGALAKARVRASNDPTSPWDCTSGWRLNEPALVSYTLEVDGTPHVVTLKVDSDDYEMVAPVAGLTIWGNVDDNGRLVSDIDGEHVSAGVAFNRDTVTLFLSDGPFKARRIDLLAAAGDVDDVEGRLTAPMPGKIVSVHVRDGESVERGAPLVVVEAMKMEHTIAAPSDGVVKAVNYQVGDLVEEGADLLVFEPIGEA